MSNDFSGERFIGFMDYLSNKGLLKKATASARKAAVVAFLGILSEEETMDVRTIDLDSLADRFANLQGGNFKPQSLRVYKSRYKSAYRDFISYKDNPSGFKPAVSTRRRSKLKKGNSDNGELGQNPSTQQPRKIRAAPSVTPSLSEETIIFPIPIRRGLVVKIAGLPIDLTSDEAKKIADVVQALASA